ncbi:MAG: hypothetical protein AMJ69_04030 [Gammaproteobacteria bacterium SG8_47]|nr:MAG: hypothetical protein AMJ69_04030 [Gammaproteobacteria bacterium SG8_47]
MATQRGAWLGGWVLCVGCLCNVALAQAETPIIVTATRTAQTADETLSSVIIIDREEITRNPLADVADLLRLRAGVEISRQGGIGQLTTVFIRGTESNHTVFMIDGVKINDANIGLAAIQNIDTQMIERIEVVKGPRSTLYGSEAIGGVINIITRRGGEGVDVDASIEAGSFSTVGASFSAQRGVEDKGAGIVLSAQSSDGFPTQQDSDIDRGYDNLSAQLYANQRLSAITEASFSHWHTAGNTEYLSFDLQPLDQDYRNTATALTLDQTPMDIWTSRLAFSYTIDDIEQNQSPDFVNSARAALDWQNDIQLGAKHLLTAGAYLARADAEALSFGTSYNEHDHDGAVFVQDDLHLGDHHLLVGARFSDYERFDSQLTWNADYGWQLASQTHLTASAGTAYRAPAATDLYGFGGNPDLQPERSLSYELGLNQGLGTRHQFDVRAFETTIQDLIEYNFPADLNENIGAARIQGVELSYLFALDAWRLQAQATAQDPRNLDTGEQLLRRAKRSASLALLYRGPSYSLGGDVLYSGEREDFGGLTLDSYTLVNLSASWEMTASWQAMLRVENALDEAYELASGYNTPERSFFLGLRWQSSRRGGAL